jgi:ribose transport system substrate-binding protein
VAPPLAADRARQARPGLKKARGALVEVEVPRELRLFAPVVTADNVGQFLPIAFQS